MPSLEKRNGIYRLIVRFAGRKQSRSLRTRNVREAKGLLYRAEDNLRRVEHGILSVPEGADLTAFLLSDGRIARVQRSTPTITTLGRLCDAYIESIQGGTLESTTLHCANVHINHLKRLMGKGFRIHAISHSDLQNYVDSRSKEKGRRKRPVSKTTMKKEIATLTTIWRWATRRNLVDRTLPKEGLRYPKDDEKPPFQVIDDVQRKIAAGRLTDEEEASLWDSVFLPVANINDLLDTVKQRARHVSLHPMFAAAAFTGARCSELRRSRIDDIDLRGGWFWLRERKRIRGTRSLRNVPIFDELKEILQQWLRVHPGGPHTFCLLDVAKSRKVTSTPRPFTSEEARHHFHQTLLGTQWSSLRGWHVLRHSFCSNSLAAGIDQRLIDEWVGHQTEEMRKRYRHLFPNQQRAAIAKVFRMTGAPDEQFQKRRGA